MIVVLMPWRPTKHRIPHFELVTSHLSGLGWPIITADSGDYPFSSARSYNKAAEEAGDWKVAVLHEADVWVRLNQIHEAVDMVDPLTYAYNRVTSLNAYGSNLFHQGLRGFSDSQVERRLGPTGRMTPGGVRVVTRELWDTVGGFDPRFIGWGGEDNHFRMKCRQATGGQAPRVAGMLYQLWHPRPANDPYFARTAENMRLWKSLKRAAR